MLLSEFTKCLTGTGGRQLRYSSPATAEEALRITINVSQTAVQEVRDNAFYVDAEVAEITPAGRLREPAEQHTTAKKSVAGAANVQKPQWADQHHMKQTAAASNGQQRNHIVC